MHRAHEKNGSPLASRCSKSEKELTRRSDEIARQRRASPWVESTRPTGSRPSTVMRLSRTCSAVARRCSCTTSCSDRIGRRGARVCSALARRLRRQRSAHGAPRCRLRRGRTAHRSTRCVAYKKRMGWELPLGLSSFGSSFKYDFHVTFDPDRRTGCVQLQGPRAARGERTVAWRDWSGEQPGMSAFAREGDDGVPHLLRLLPRLATPLVVRCGSGSDRAPLGRERRRLLVVPSARRVSGRAAGESPLTLRACATGRPSDRATGRRGDGRRATGDERPPGATWVERIPQAACRPQCLPCPT